MWSFKVIQKEQIHKRYIQMFLTASIFNIPVFLGSQSLTEIWFD